MTEVMTIFSVLTILAACGVVVSKQPVHSALFLILTLFLVAVHFALLGAHFLAATQVLVYAGAIMVLVVFVIMLLGLDAHVLERKTATGAFGAALAMALFVTVFWTISSRSYFYVPRETAAREAQLAKLPVADGSTAAIGNKLFTEYLYPFELTSLLILAGIVGAVMLGVDKRRPLKPGRGLKAKQAAES